MNKYLILSLFFCSFLSYGTAQQTTLRIAGGNLVMKPGTHMVLTDASWVNNGQVTADEAKVIFRGTQSDTISGSSPTTFGDLVLDKTSGDLFIKTNTSVDDSLIFIGGLLDMNGNDLTLGMDNGVLAGESETSRVIGPNGGELIKVADISTAPTNLDPGNMGAHITASSSPGVTIIRRGHVPETIPGNGAIQRYFDFIPTTNISNCTIRVSYFDAELNGLTEAALEAWRLYGSNWFNDAPEMTDDLANYVETSMDSLAKTTLGEGALKLRSKVFLQGAYATANGLMNDNLRTGGLIPTTEPYTALGYTQVGGGGESIDADVLNTTGDNAIMDWVFLELRDKTDSSIVVRTQSALLQRDGDVVGLDGVSPLSFAGLDQDEYYLMLKHRNHLGIRSPGIMTLARVETNHDFSTGLAQAWNKTGPVNASMADLDGNGTSYGLFTGDVNTDNFINSTDFQGTSNLVSPNQFSVYTIGDLNLDGNLNATDFQTSNNVSSPNKIGHIHD